MVPFLESGVTPSDGSTSVRLRGYRVAGPLARIRVEDALA